MRERFNYHRVRERAYNHTDKNVVTGICTAISIELMQTEAVQARKNGMHGGAKVVTRRTYMSPKKVSRRAAPNVSSTETPTNAKGSRAVEIDIAACC